MRVYEWMHEWAETGSMQHHATLIDPYARSVTAAIFEPGHQRWFKMMLRGLTNPDGMFEEICRPLHHDLPFDAISEYIGGGSCVPIFANAVAPGIYLVLHDDLRDQGLEREAFVLTLDGCTLDPRIACKMHWERGVLVRGDGRMLPRTSFHVEWRFGSPREGGGYAVYASASPGEVNIVDTVDSPVACGFCGVLETTQSYGKCSRCRHVRYCSRKCQKAHWKEHKITCAAASREQSQVLMQPPGVHKPR